MGTTDYRFHVYITKNNTAAKLKSAKTFSAKKSLKSRKCQPFNYKNENKIPEFILKKSRDNWKQIQYYLSMFREHLH